MSNAVPLPPAPGVPLTQGQELAAPLGCGAMTIYECSNRSDTQPIPRLTLLQPHFPARGDDHPGTPANSLTLEDRSVWQLYTFLHAYYTRSGKHLITP